MGLHTNILDCGSADELLVQAGCEQWVGQCAEVRLEDGGDAADVIEPIRIAEVKRVIVAAFEQLRDHLGLTCTARLTIYALVFQS